MLATKGLLQGDRKIWKLSVQLAYKRPISNKLGGDFKSAWQACVHIHSQTHACVHIHTDIKIFKKQTTKHQIPYFEYISEKAHLNYRIIINNVILLLKQPLSY